MSQKSSHILVPDRKILSGRFYDAIHRKEDRNGFDSRGHIPPIIKQFFSRGNERHTPIDEKLNFLNQPDKPILTFSLFTAALSLFLFILFLSERL